MSILINKIKQAVGISPLKVKLKKIDERAVIPSYAHDGDVGMDLTAINVEYDEERDMYIYHTGLSVASKKHYGILLFPRSSNRKTDAYLCNHVGIVDSYIYRGEIMLCFKNRDSIRQRALEISTNAYFNAVTEGKGLDEAVNERNRAWNEVTENPMVFAPYKVGDRIAQMVTIPYPNVRMEVVDELSETERGEGGFGSTGS